MDDNCKTHEIKGVYTLVKPSDTLQLPLILDSPHSGRTYPDDFACRIAHDDLICGEDRFVDQLFEDAPHYGASFLHAHFPRCYIDPNRHYADISPTLFKETWHGDLPLRTSEKSRAGIGLIRERFTNGQDMYDRKLSQEEILKRIETYYMPYHDALANEIQRLRERFGYVVHVNCHSMPEATSPMQKSVFRNKRTDIILGDRDGTSCSKKWRRTFTDLFERLDFSVLHNTPYKGVEIVKRYGLPDARQHSIQIEINRGLYLDKAERDKSEGFNKLKNQMNDFMESLSLFIKNNDEVT